MRYEKIKINTVMKRLTKEIAERISKTHHLSKIFTFGVVRGYEFYLGIKPFGGKVGFPCVFTITDEEEVVFVRDWEEYNIIRKEGNFPERVF